MVQPYPVPAGEEPKFLVIDGAHRTAALRELILEVRPEQRPQFEFIAVDVYRPFSDSEIIKIAETQNSKTSKFVGTNFYDEYYFIKKFVSTLSEDGQNAVLDKDGRWSSPKINEEFKKAGYGTGFFRTVVYVKNILHFGI